MPGGDEVVTGWGDADGWHVAAAGAGTGWAWRPLATLLPGGGVEQRWIGAQCLTGDGRSVVAIAAPWSAQNDDAGRDQGAFAYTIDAHTGVVRPLLQGVSLASFNPGCGAGSTVALTRYLGGEEHTTQVLVADAASGAITDELTTGGEVVQAVPTTAGVVAARGSRIVRFDGAHREHVLATLPGTPYDLRPDATGGVQLLARESTGTSGVWHVGNTGAQRIGDGPLGTVQLFQGRAGHNVLVGAGHVPGPAANLRVAAAGTRAEAASLDGGVFLTGTARGAQSGSGAWMTTRATNGGVIQSGRLPAAPASTAEQRVPRQRDVTAALGPAATTPPNTTNPTCAVPRNDPRYQVPQPNAQQVDWAIQEGVRGLLTGANGRPAGAWNLGLPAYQPSVDFPPPHLAGAPTGTPVPPQVVEAVLAQESNWAQASWHAAPGTPGNPLVASYYGITANRPTLDFDNADCGYGIAQITDGMRKGEQPFPTQAKIAVDYAENIAAGLQILGAKWNSLYSNGITVNGGDPTRLQDWYFAVWAYNSGINPQGSTGNTTGCTPGPSCTDSNGSWGLGWGNNPINPIYPVDRAPFLSTSYADAAHPQWWPYQEKILGWMDVPLLDGGGNESYAGVGRPLAQAGRTSLCGSQNHCNPSTSPYCTLSSNTDPNQWHCWWHWSVTFDCSVQQNVACPAGWFTVSATAAEPASSPPHRQCQGTAGVVVADEPTDLNLVGCPNPPGWNAGGSFTIGSPGMDHPTSLADVDLHQLGAGLGGHLYFSHTLDAHDPTTAPYELVGTWRPPSNLQGFYDVSVYVPDVAAAEQATYTILNSNGHPSVRRRLDQNAYGDQWVSIGQYELEYGFAVQMSNRIEGGAGGDVAWTAVAFRPVYPYVALGDSFTSGEGAPADGSPPPFIPGTDEPYTDKNAFLHGDGCHRSELSYPELFATHSATIGGFDNFVFAACSGDVIADFESQDWEGSQSDIPLRGNGFGSEPAQLDMIPPDAKLVTLTAGGNDAGFAPIVTTCIHMWLTLQDCPSSFPDENQTIDNIEPQLVDLYQQVTARAPNARVVVLDYPQFVAVGTGPGCLLSSADTQWIRDEVTYFDSKVQDAVNAVPGVELVKLEGVFAGHEACTSDAYVTGPPPLGPGANALPFHPNAKGNTAMANALYDQVKNQFP